MNNKSLLLLIVLAIGMMSCKTTEVITRTVQEPQYMGNEYKEMKGYTENQILRTMSSPTRTESDGADGKILVYEDKSVVTASNSSYTTGSYTSGRATTTAGTNIWTGAPQVNTNASSSTVTRHNTANESVTYEEKAFVNFFINPEGVCYDVTTNVGDRYSEEIKENVCYEVPKRLNPDDLWLLITPAIGIPVLIAYLVQKARYKNAKNWKMVECE